MKRKIMAIIYSDKGNFLLLRTNPKIMTIDIWFVVSGHVENNETEENAVKREIKEETKLKILEIKPTNHFSVYDWPKGSGIMNHEEIFIVKVKEEKPKLSIEHTDYKWLAKKEFLKQIDWDEKIDPKRKLNELVKNL